jgi:hypothetical protein
MPVYFQNLADYTDPQMFKRSLQEARRAKQGKFFYVPSSTAAGGPALLMTAGRMSPDLKRALKKGGSKIGGKFENRPDGRLIIWTDREANRSSLAEDIRAMMLSVGVSIPLEDIHVRTPGDIKRRKKRREAAGE